MEGNCFLCGKWGPLDKHHLMSGPNRQKADRLGLMVHICRDCHNKAHTDPQMNRELKRYGQSLCMCLYGWDEEKFIQEFGKNYL